MRIPIIKVTDNSSGYTSRVGADVHDVLSVDRESGTISYLNLQNCCGSEKYSSKDIPEYSFHCVEAPIDGEDPIIEFVSFREFVKIIFKEHRSKKRAERKLRRMIKRIL